MKFVRFDGRKTGLVVGADCDTVLDVGASAGALDAAAAARIAEVLPGDGSGSWSPMIARWPALRSAFATLAQRGEACAAGVVLQPISAVRLEAPIPCPERRIFSLGGNTVAHMQGVFAARMPDVVLTVDDIYKPKRAGAAPVGFNIFPDSVIGPDAVMTPPAFAKMIDYEGECAAIVGSAGRDQGQGTVLWGYTAWNDFGMRDGHLGMLPTTPPMAYSLNLWKNFDGANACGPWVVVDEVHDVRDLRCEVFVNGERRQDWRTTDMVYSFADLFDHLSRYMDLKPGDMATSGTGAGTALETAIDSSFWLHAGDVVEVRVEGVAPLKTTIA